jgi:DNA-binding NarL/FixJ family response regulator
MEKIKLILVDDHTLVRDGLKLLVQNDKRVLVIGEASNYSELIKLLAIELPDIILMDISLPDLSGIEITRILTLKYPSINVIVLSMYINEEYILESIKAGAKGYLAKNTTKVELLKAIYNVFDNGEFFGEQITKIILKSYLTQIKNPPNEIDDISKKLTRREEEILNLLLNGASNKDIAEKLFISIRTVESHKNHLMNKLDVKSNIDLLKYAVKNKIIEI